MIAYRELPPPPELAGVIDKLWEMRGDAAAATHRVLPDGGLDLVLHVGHCAHVVGPLLGPLDVSLPARVHIVGACVRAGAARAVLGVDADAVAGGAAPLADVLGAPARAMAEAVSRAPSGRALAELAAQVAGRARGGQADPLAAEAARRLRLRPAQGIAGLAAGLGVSARQLERRFRAHVGLGPKAFARVVRFDAAVRRLGGGTPLALLALECGYADQTHLNHEFRALAGRSPRELVANRQDAEAADR